MLQHYASAFARDIPPLIPQWDAAVEPEPAIEEPAQEAELASPQGPLSYQDECDLLLRQGKDPVIEDRRVVTTLLVHAATHKGCHFPELEGVGNDRLLHLVRNMIATGTLELARESVHASHIPNVQITAQGLREYGRIVGPGGPGEMLRAQPQLNRANPFLDGRSIALVWKRRDAAETSRPANVSPAGLDIR